MKIYLFIDHTALFLDDKKPTVTVEPACTGVLEIDGQAFRVENGGLFPALRELIGHVRVAFTPEGGPRYIGIKPHMKEGVPVSRVDYAAEYIPMRIKMDALERQLDKLARAYHELSAAMKHDALSFLTHNTKKTEV